MASNNAKLSFIRFTLCVGVCGVMCDKWRIKHSIPKLKVLEFIEHKIQEIFAEIT